MRPVLSKQTIDHHLTTLQCERYVPLLETLHPSILRIPSLVRSALLSSTALELLSILAFDSPDSIQTLRGTKLEMEMEMESHPSLVQCALVATAFKVLLFPA